MSAFSLRSAGYWLASVAPFGDLAVTWRYGDGGGGLAEVSWSMDLPYDYDHPALRNGALVELFDGGQRVGMAKLAEPGRTETGRSFTALGVYREAEKFLCFDSSGTTSTIPNEAVDQAALRGCILTRGESLTDNAIVTGSVTEGLNYLADLLDAYAVETSQYWRVDGNGKIFAEPPPITPTWQLIPGVVDPQPASDGWATRLFGRYQTSGTLHTATAADAAAEARWGGRREQGIDLTALGSIDSTRAGNRLAGLLARGKAKLSIADRLEVNRYQLQTMGGQPADLSMVRAGQVVRIHGLAAYSQWLDGNPWMDMPLGEVTWVDGADTITLAPINMAATSYEDLLAGGGASSGASGGAGLSGAGPVGTGGGAVTSVAGKTGAVLLVKGDVGLGNVDNTSDLAKPISTAASSALAGKANSSHTHAASDVTSGTLALARLPVAASGTSSSSQVVRADDSRLSDARTPAAHTHAASDVTSGTLAAARLPAATTAAQGAVELATNAEATTGTDTTRAVTPSGLAAAIAAAPAIAADAITLPALSANVWSSITLPTVDASTAVSVEFRDLTDDETVLMTWVPYDATHVWVRAGMAISSGVIRMYVVGPGQ